MPIALPEDLAPEVYPLAWLVGRWRGEGVIAYPGIDEAAFVQDVVFDHDGGPYLRYESTLRLVEPAGPGPDGAGVEGRGVEGSDAKVSLPVWSTETGYWRVPPVRPDDLDADKHAVEVMLADPVGWLTLYVGAVGNGRIDVVHDLIARTTTSAEVTASKRTYGLVEGDLLWVWELAAFGNPLQNYASARLVRQED